MQRTGSTLPVVAPASGSGSGSGSDESDALMRRPSVSVVEHDGVGADDDAKASAGLQSDEEDDEDARGRRETDETNLAYMWSLLLATLAESVNACFVPNWYILDFNINAAATMINFVGPFMDGMAFGYEEIHKSRADATLTPCLQYRAAFLGVFTSYSYMVDHAGDLSEDYFLIGPLYIIASLAIACASFHLGKLFILVPAMKRLLQLLASSTIVTKLPSFQLASILFIIVTAARAVFGDPGFVQDPKEPRFISSIRVADGEELILGIFMSCSGILISDYLADRFEPQPDANGHVSFLDWGNIICNFVSCWLTCLAYEASKFSPNHVRNNLLVMKFVSSFCGSISNFSAGISHIMLLWQGGNRYGAMWNLALHLVTGLVFLPYLRKSVITTI